MIDRVVVGDEVAAIAKMVVELGLVLMLVQVIRFEVLMVLRV